MKITDEEKARRLADIEAYNQRPAFQKEVARIAGSKLDETEHPPGSNRGPFVDECLRAVGLDPEKGSYPWCAAFVTWCIYEAAKTHGDLPPWWKRLLGKGGRDCIFEGSASVHGLLVKNAALAIVEPDAFCVGLHFTNDGHGHAVFIVGKTPDGLFVTIEGNSDRHGSRTGGSVVSNHRPREYFHAFLRVE